MCPIFFFFVVAVGVPSIINTKKKDRKTEVWQKKQNNKVNNKGSVGVQMPFGQTCPFFGKERQKKSQSLHLVAIKKEFSFSKKKGKRKSIQKRAIIAFVFCSLHLFKEFKKQQDEEVVVKKPQSHLV